jgi:hypothetical protein
VTAREIVNERFGLLGVIHFPGLPQDPPHRSVHRFGQPLHDVARLVNLATLDRRIASKRAADRLGQRLRAIDDEQTSHSWIASSPRARRGAFVPINGGRSTLGKIFDCPRHCGFSRILTPSYHVIIVTDRRS